MAPDAAQAPICPGFQCLASRQLHPRVRDFAGRAMELKIPHNYFTVWMVTPARDLTGSVATTCPSCGSTCYSAGELLRRCGNKANAEA